MTPQERIAALEAENAVQREQIAVLVARVQELEARLAKTSHNSGKPPSSDGLARKTRSLRRRSGKKPGGQLGHRGETLRLVVTPDTVEEHRPLTCTGCHAPLPQEAAVVARERRQVHDLPLVRLVVQEHQALHVRCPACGQVSVGAFPTAVPSRGQYGPRLRAVGVYLVEQQVLPYGRVREALAELCGVRLSVGTLVTLVRQAAATLASVETAVKEALRRAPCLHSDESGVRRAGRLAWAHVTSTQRLTHYAIHAKRGATATDAIGILPGYRWVSVHDGWQPYQTYTACRHALCNIHHPRELTFLEEAYHQTWATDLKTLLLEMKTVTEAARAAGQAALPPAARDAFGARYEALLTTGLAANPPPQRETTDGRRRRGRIKHSPARNLLQRLWLRREQVLAFLDDLTIPFDNNQAERDLRMLKVQQKISGGFRSDAGADAYACIRGYLSTLAKQGRHLLTALETVFTGSPLYSALG